MENNTTPPLVFDTKTSTKVFYAHSAAANGGTAAAYRAVDAARAASTVARAAFFHRLRGGRPATPMRARLRDALELVDIRFGLYEDWDEWAAHQEAISLVGRPAARLLIQAAAASRAGKDPRVVLRAALKAAREARTLAELARRVYAVSAITPRATLEALLAQCREAEPLFSHHWPGGVGTSARPWPTWWVARFLE